LLKTVYATGLTGFIGSHLLTSLLAEYDLILNFRRNNTIDIHAKGQATVSKNISLDVLEEYPSNTLFHLATNYNPYPKSEKHISSVVDSNFTFPMKLIIKLNPDPNKFTLITTSSYMQLLDKEYQNIYSLSKDMFLNWYQGNFNNLINLYLFDSFGVNDSRNKIVDNFIKKILKEEEIIIPKNNIEINLLKVDTIIAQIIRGSRMSNGNYLIASNKTISINSLALLLMDIMQKRTRVTKKGTSTNYLDYFSSKYTNLIDSESENSLDKDLEDHVIQLIK